MGYFFPLCTLYYFFHLLSFESFLDCFYDWWSRTSPRANLGRWPRRPLNLLSSISRSLVAGRLCRVCTSPFSRGFLPTSVTRPPSQSPLLSTPGFSTRFPSYVFSSAYAFPQREIITPSSPSPFRGFPVSNKSELSMFYVPSLFTSSATHHFPSDLRRSSNSLVLVSLCGGRAWELVQIHC